MVDHQCTKLVVLAKQFLFPTDIKHRKQFWRKADNKRCVTFRVTRKGHPHMNREDSQKIKKVNYLKLVVTNLVYLA